MIKNAGEESHARAKTEKTRAGIKPKITRNNSCCVILFGLDTCPLLPHSRVGGRLTMPKYSVRSGGNSAVKRNRIKQNARRFYIPNHCKFLFALRTAHDEIYRDLHGNISQWNELRAISCLRTGGKDKILCMTARIRAIERRKSKTIFCDGVFQFRSMSSAISAYDTSLSLRPGSATRPR